MDLEETLKNILNDTKEHGGPEGDGRRSGKKENSGSETVTLI